MCVRSGKSLVFTLKFCFILLQFVFELKFWNYMSDSSRGKRRRTPSPEESREIIDINGNEATVEGGKITRTTLG